MCIYIYIHAYIYIYIHINTPSYASLCPAKQQHKICRSLLVGGGILNSMWALCLDAVGLSRCSSSNSSSGTNSSSCNSSSSSSSSSSSCMTTNSITVIIIIGLIIIDIDIIIITGCKLLPGPRVGSSQANCPNGFLRWRLHKYVHIYIYV